MEKINTDYERRMNLENLVKDEPTVTQPLMKWNSVQNFGVT